MAKLHYKYSGLGKRKTSIARVYINPGDGKFIVNKKALEEYFPTKTLQTTVNEAFELTGTSGKFDVNARVVGGGVSGQAQAVRHAISLALLGVEGEYRSKLKSAGMITRDARKKERKKYGQPGARKRFQYSKR